MSAPSVACPTTDLLRAFGAGKLDHIPASAVARHLETCPVCRKALDAMSPDSFERQLQAASPPDATPPPKDRTGPTFHHAPETSSFALDGFEVIEELGRGGMGVVYKARQTDLRRLVALKVVHGDVPGGRVRTEIEATARLAHANVVQLYEVREGQGRTVLVLEYVEGGSLAERLDGKPLPPGEAALLVRALGRAIAWAHERQVVHRDLKPSNVLLERASGGESGWSPKISDFGLAKLAEGRPVQQTASGAIVGTPAYMAPEQAAGRTKELGPACDIYGLGAILYECLTGRAPFAGADVMEVLLQVCGEEPIPVRRLQPKVPRDLEVICLKCLEKSPSDRYLSAAELVADLTRFVGGETIVARPLSRGQRLLRAAWRRRGLLAAALVVAIAATVGVLGWQRGSRARALRAEALATARESLKGLLGRVEEVNLRTIVANGRATLYDELTAAEQLYERFHKEDPADAQVQEELGDIQAKLGWLEAVFKEKEKALGHLKQAEGHFATLASSADASERAREKLADARNDLGTIYTMLDQHEQVREAYAGAIRARREVQASTRLSVALQQRVAQDWLNFGSYLLSRGDAAGAEARFAEAQSQVERGLEAFPDNSALPFVLVAVLQNRGAALAALGRVAEADRAFQATFVTLDRIVTASHLGLAEAPIRLDSHLMKGRSAPNLNAMLNKEAAGNNWLRTVVFYRERCAREPRDPALKRNLARSMYYHAMILFVPAGDAAMAEALSVAELACSKYDELLAGAPADRTLAQEYAQLCVHTGHRLLVRRDYQSIGSWCQRAEGLLQTTDLWDDDRATVKALLCEFFVLRASLSMLQMRALDALLDLDRADRYALRRVNPELFSYAVAQARAKMVLSMRQGLTEQAVADAEGIASLADLPGEPLYDAACVFSVASADRPLPVREKFARRAIELVRRAFAAGFGKDPVQKMGSMVGEPIDHVRKDKDLDAVRGLPEYRELIDQLTREAPTRGHR